MAGPSPRPDRRRGAAHQQHDQIRVRHPRTTRHQRGPEVRPQPVDPRRGLGVFLNVLHAKAESAGRVVVEVDPRNTSRTCPKCGHCTRQNRVTQAEFRCVACGHTAHADVNAASNILRAGLARQAAPAA
ncbi:zinc ribbon domain-containing protein [Micromonospora zhanjiangensis]